MEQYKTVPVRLPDKTPVDLPAIQRRFNQGFKREDIFLDLSPEACLINVREIDMRELRATVVELIEAHDAIAAKTFLRETLQAVESIRSYGLRGRKRLFVGYNKERKVRHRQDKEKRRGQHYYANDHAFHRQASEPPSEYRDRIVCGDSSEVLARLPDNCVDLVFTSPPYNFGLEYCESPDDYQWEKYYEKLFGVFDECIRVLKFGGRIAVNVQPLFSDYIPSHHLISNFFMRRKLVWKGEIMWEKNNYNCKYTAWGSWKSPSSPYLYLYTTNIKGVSSMRLHRELGISQKAAWFMLHRLRKAAEMETGLFSGPIEVDETYFGGKRRNMHNRKRAGLEGRGPVGKTAVVGAKDRATRRVAAKVVENTDRATLHGFIGDHAEAGAATFTDEARAYQGLPNHETVKHSVREYVKGQAHTNGIESFWALLKRGHQGIYHKMSPKHLDRYVREFSHRHNLREADTLEQMEAVVSGMARKRLKYAELIADNGLPSGARA